MLDEIILRHHHSEIRKITYKLEIGTHNALDITILLGNLNYFLHSGKIEYVNEAINIIERYPFLHQYFLKIENEKGGVKNRIRL